MGVGVCINRERDRQTDRDRDEQRETESHLYDYLLIHSDEMFLVWVTLFVKQIYLKIIRS